MREHAKNVIILACDYYICEVIIFLPSFLFLISCKSHTCFHLLMNEGNNGDINHFLTIRIPWGEGGRVSYSNSFIISCLVWGKVCDL